MRSSALIVLCLISLVFAGPVSAACATGMLGCGDNPSAAYDGSAGMSDCDKGGTDQSQGKAQRCNHAACCGYHLIAFPEAGEVSVSRSPEVAAVATLTQHLTGSGWETLLDPPRS